MTATAAATTIQSGKPVKGRLPPPTAWTAPRTPPSGALPLPADDVAPRTPPCWLVPEAEAPVALVPATLPVAVTDVEPDVDDEPWLVLEALLWLDALLLSAVLEVPDSCVHAVD